MADLIDRQALMEEDFTDRFVDPCDQAVFEAIVEEAPAVDAVEVFRCRDCEWGGKCEVESLLREVDKIPDPYCAAGKRRAADG